MVSLDQPLPDAELDEYLADIEQAMLDTGFAQPVAARRQSRHPYRVARANHEPLS